MSLFLLPLSPWLVAAAWRLAVVLVVWPAGWTWPTGVAGGRALQGQQQQQQQHVGAAARAAGPSLRRACQAG
ncbi:hypothetical protein BC831DRAFT_449518 [Entophlyctis helioformis]|nr:hypothetical protein BC831DRAFT_449518 [Entophlyctis helioformis]